MAFDPTKPVGAGHGGTVVILADNLNLGNGKTIAALHVKPNGERHAYFHYPDGGRLAAHPDEEFRLFNIPQKRSGWVNVYCHAGVITMNDRIMFSHRDDAEKAAGNARIACLHIEFEEGEGL